MSFIYLYDAVMIFFLLIVLLYMIPMIICFFLKRNLPAISSRSPFLVLLSSFGILCYVTINSLAPLLNFGSSDAPHYAHAICMCDRFRMLFCELLVIFPYVVRTLRILKAKRIITKLNGRSRFQIKFGPLMSQRILFAIICLLSIGFLILIAITAAQPQLNISLPSDITRACQEGLNPQNYSFIRSWILGLVDFSLQVCLLLYGLIKIRNLSPKYGVKQQLFLVLILWTVCWVATFSIDRIDKSYNFIYKLLYNVNLTAIFTFSVTFWIFKSKEYNPIASSDQNTLIYQYPEALYLWMPNFYFHRYLQLNSPDLVPYRPFLADILRYDYQALQEYNTDEQKENYLRQLAQYIWARYLQKDSEWYCDFREDSEIIDQLNKRVMSHENIFTEQLFEFVRPWLQNLLNDEYLNFMRTPLFKEMKIKLDQEEVFEWILERRI